MKSEVFLISRQPGKDDFERFTSSPNIVVEQIHTTEYLESVRATVYYETLEDMADRERVKLMAHSRIADECSASQEYKMMPTQKARKRWLLAEWGICSSDAMEIIELSDDATDNRCSNAGVSE